MNLEYKNKTKTFVLSLANKRICNGSREDAQSSMGSLDWRKRYRENERKFNMESSLSRKKGAFAGQRKPHKTSPNEYPSYCTALNEDKNYYQVMGKLRERKTCEIYFTVCI